MQTPSDVQKTAKRNPKFGPPFYFRFALVLACLCLGMGLLLPAIKHAALHGHPMPPGQLQADARTLIATVHYLFAAESDFKMNPARFPGGSQNFVQRTNSQSSEMFNGYSDRTTRFDFSSNPPVQI